MKPGWLGVSPLCGRQAAPQAGLLGGRVTRTPGPAAGSTEVTCPWNLEPAVLLLQGQRGQGTARQGRRGGAGRQVRRLTVCPGRASAKQPALDKRDRSSRPRPRPAVTSGLSVDMTATGGGSLAPVHVSTLDLLGAQWPEIMSPMRVAGWDIRGGRLGVCCPLFFLIH